MLLFSPTVIQNSGEPFPLRSRPRTLWRKSSLSHGASHTGIPAYALTDNDRQFVNKCLDSYATNAAQSTLRRQLTTHKSIAKRNGIINQL